MREEALEAALRDDTSVEMMMEIAKMVREGEGFEEFGASDKRSYLIGLISGIAIGRGTPFELVIALIKHPTTQAMVEGIDPEL